MIEGELGTFLRSRREAVTPAEVGLPDGARRRTPGLRRAELATLAGVSVDYLIRIEQGRDTHPSAQVLAALAEALRLSEDDMHHLRQLAAISSGTELCPQARAAARTVRPTVRAMLEHLEPAPAFVVNHLGDLLAWTDGYDRLARPLGVLDGDEPNLLWFTFGGERARAAFPDWNDVADEQIANLHAELRGPDDDARALADHLARTAGADFTDRWDRRPVGRSRTGITAFAHPDVGLLRMAFETLDLSDPDRQRLVIYLPADSATSAGLDRLAGRQPGALRSVRTG
ncbi:MAG TPA: helix-turn-helix domain-containing protein [Ilumatobacteraceae bacterium]|nr:helix-turn-helix domain-containing protein [Ilumatobacteraceae bacterium]